MMEREELDRRFTYHPPKGDQADRYARLRAKAKALAEEYDTLCPESREKSIAFAELESSLMWANASIARRE